MVLARRLVAVLVTGQLLLTLGSALRADTVVGWNNLGLHCLDADFSVFSILPPFNTINAQLINASGHLVTNVTGLSISYEAVADPSGSINRTSVGKTDFWEFVLPLFGVALDPDVGLPVPGPNSFRMPGAANVPQAMSFEPAAQWFAAAGIPLTPYDDALLKNPYPLMRLVARRNGAIIATSDIVLPVSDEMDCRACHASGAGPAAQPVAGWVNDPDPQRDYRLNILRRHDEQQAGSNAYANALAAKGYHAAGLYATVVSNGVPILCAGCHRSEALPNTGLIGIPPLTASMHAFHAHVEDPTNHLTLETDANRSACYRCHPGSETRCLRGAMGAAVAADGTLAIQCQSCHGPMSAVGAANRTGWLDEPNCQACHTGHAVTNNGLIRYSSALESNGQLRVAVDQTFATNPDTPGAGQSLYRFSRGHGGLYCAACHGSTHAEFPSRQRNDNLASLQHQGHVGVLVECVSCHGTTPTTGNGGPHGLHPVGQVWVTQHASDVATNGATSCRFCHGLDYRGTVLSRTQADRALEAFGPQTFWRGFQIGCYTCHSGPGSAKANPNKLPTVTDAFAGTVTNTPVAIALHASDPNGDPLTLRIVSQPPHGTVGLVGTTATYYPEAGYAGSDAFTFAASDGSTDSNLGMVTVTVSPSGCSYGLSTRSGAFDAFGGIGTVGVVAAGGCSWTAVSQTAWIVVTNGAAGNGNGIVRFRVAPNATAAARTGTVSVAGLDVMVAQAASGFDVRDAWSFVVRDCQTSSQGARCRLQAAIQVRNIGSAILPPVKLAVYLSADALLDANDQLLKTYSVKKLGLGKTFIRTVNLNLPSGTTASSQHVIAVVDADDTLPDLDDANNISVFQLPP